MKETFIKKRFTPRSQAVIALANEIIVAYMADGYDLSLRQLYYQFVARGLIANSERSYKALGNVVNDARMAGLIDWDAIKDRGRDTVCQAHWNNPADLILAAAHSYQIDKWADQLVYVEVMVEKQALDGVLSPVCKELDVPFTANKGYTSVSALYETSQRLRAARKQGKACFVLYLGDHDPSGIDMTRDIQERLALLTGGVEITRLALNLKQVNHYRPPENPTKMTDTRAQGYVDQFGESSWEHDALEPSVLVELLREAVVTLRDESTWDEATTRE